MSGVSKDKSFLLKFGGAGKACLKSAASKLLNCFKGPTSSLEST